MSYSIKFGDRRIGDGSPVFIIAEAGVNHNGDIQMAKELIEVAAQAGANYIKFQLFKAEQLVSQSAGATNYQKENLRDNKLSQYDLLKKLELNQEAFIAQLQGRT